MKTITANHIKPILAGCGVLAVATLFGVFVLTSAPDFAYLPEMAERPVLMPDRAPIYVQKYEVSIAEWNACHAAGGCSLLLRPPGNVSADETPATGLSFVDVTEYLNWINGNSDVTYRLPTLIEWEHMAAPVLPETPDPIFTDPELTWASAYLM